jgi:hypothetical protein
MVDSRYVFEDARVDLPAPTEFFPPCRQGDAAGSDMTPRASARPDKVCEYCGFWLKGQ